MTLCSPMCAELIIGVINKKRTVSGRSRGNEALILCFTLLGLGILSKSRDLDSYSYRRTFDIQVPKPSATRDIPTAQASAVRNLRSVSGSSKSQNLCRQPVLLV